MVTTATTSATSTTRGGVFPAGVGLVLGASKVGAAGTGRGRGGRTHTHVGQGRLVAAVGKRLGGRGHVNILLWKLLWELEGILMRHARHLLQGIESSAGSKLLGRHHAHVHVLLSSLDLLLLLLQQLDLLLDGKLVTRVLEHADQRRELGRAPAMGNVKPASSGTGDTTRRRRLRLLGRLLLLLLVHCVRSDVLHVECEYGCG